MFNKKLSKWYPVLSYKINHFKVWTPITFYQAASRRIIVAVLELPDQKLDTAPPINVSNSVKTPSLIDFKGSDHIKNMSYAVDIELVAIKTSFMNEIYKLKREIGQ